MIRLTVAEKSANHSPPLVQERLCLFNLVDGYMIEQLVARRAREAEDLPIAVFDQITQLAIAEAVNFELLRGMPAAIAQNRQEIFELSISRPVPLTEEGQVERG